MYLVKKCSKPERCLVSPRRRPFFLVSGKASIWGKFRPWAFSLRVRSPVFSISYRIILPLNNSPTTRHPAYAMLYSVTKTR
jgi:hypothetical protein